MNFNISNKIDAIIKTPENKNKVRLSMVLILCIQYFVIATALSKCNLHNAEYYSNNSFFQRGRGIKNQTAIKQKRPINMGLF